MQPIVSTAATLATFSPLPTIGAAFGLAGKVALGWAAVSTGLGVLALAFDCDKAPISSSKAILWIVAQIKGPRPPEDRWKVLLVERVSSTGQSARVYQAYDVVNKQYYNGDSSAVIAGKCCFVSLWISSYTLAYMALHILRTILVPIGEGMTALRAEWKDIPASFGSYVFQLPYFISKELSAVVLAPYYGFKLQLAAFYGVRNPLEGRKWLATIERAWHGKLRSCDLSKGRESPFRGKTPSIQMYCQLAWAAVSESKFKHTRFLAYCMQPLQGGVVNNVFGARDFVKNEFFK